MCPFSSVVDSYISLVLQAAGGGLAGDNMSSEGMNGIRKWTPLFAAISVVMVVTITLQAKTVAWDEKTARHLILASYALWSRVPIRYWTNSSRSFSRALYGGSLYC